KEYEKYVSFFRELGEVLKEGPGRDRRNKDRIADLLLFESLKTPAGQFTTLAKYTLEMPGEQAEIYYLIGETRQQLENSPYLESYKEQNQDVLLLADPVDEFLMPALGEYKGKKFIAADRAAPPPAGEQQEKFKSFFEFLKSKLPEIGDVR